jgi:Transposase DDE domain
MNRILELTSALKHQFTLDPRTLSFLARFIFALLDKRTVNLARLGNILNASVTSQSNQRRAARFLSRDATWRTSLTTWLLSFYPDHVTLAVDRTEWKFGATPINLLVIAVIHNGFAFPVLWCHLGKAGSSNSAEVTTLLEKLRVMLGTTSVLVLMDREFASHKLLEWLRNANWDFDLRLKCSALVRYKDHTHRVERYFGDLGKGHGCWLKRKVTVYGVKVFVVAFRPLKPTKDDDECVYVITNRAPSAAMSFYKQRWMIENLFAALKTRGFNFEDSHITNAARLENLLGVLCLAAFWAVQLGELVVAHQPIQRKAHGRREVSVFRLGLDALERLMRFDASVVRGLWCVWDDALRLLSGT